MRSLRLLLFLLISLSIRDAVSDEIKCGPCTPCGNPCSYPSPPPPELVPPPPPPSPPPPPAGYPPPPVSPSPPLCPPPPSEYPPPSEPISPYPPVSPSPPSPTSPYLPYGPPGVLYPVDPGYRPSGACRNWAGSWMLLVAGLLWWCYEIGWFLGVL